MDCVKLHSRILFGSFNKLEEEYEVIFQKNQEDYRFRQSQCMVAVACVYKFCYKAATWDDDVLDVIMELGDDIFYNIEFKSREKGLEVSGDSFVRSIRLGFEITQGKYILEFLHSDSFSGQFQGFRTKFHKYMESTKEGRRCVLFKCKKVSFAIFDYGTSNGAFCLYDPHGRNENGYFDYTAKSCLLFFENVDRLIDVLARDDLFSYSTFTCVPVHTIPFDGSKPMWVMTDFNTGDTSGSEDEELPETVVSVRTRSGRTVQAPEQFTFDYHPSFYRGKEREDAKRMKRNSSNFAASKDPPTQKLYNQFRGANSQFKKIFGNLINRRGNSRGNFKHFLQKKIVSGKF